MRCTIPILTADLGNVSTRGVGVYLTSNRNSNKVGTDTGEKLAYKCKIMFVCVIVYFFAAGFASEKPTSIFLALRLM